MTTSAEQMRRWTGAAILGYGFRPFFLSAAFYAAFAMAAWIGALMGLWTIPTAFSAVDWHAHEFLWGYLSAVVAGFMLTAVPNWTGRLPIVGWPLAALWSLWGLGRLAVFFSAWLTPEITALADLSFLAALLFVLGREIVAGRNWRNFKVLGVVGLFLYANAQYHCEAVLTGAAASGMALRIGVSAAIILMALIGGRIIPSFTRNWLAKRPEGFLPIAFNRLDVAVVALSAVALGFWIAAPDAMTTGSLGIAAGLAHLARLARWAGWRTLAEPLLTILHIGYLFVPVGFLLLGASVLLPGVIPYAAALHSWTAGAILVLTLAVMTRASLGHSGRPLHADFRISGIYGLALVAALARIGAALLPSNSLLIDIAGLAWILCFAGFAIVYLPLLARRSA